jgi:hypothetical protein
MKSTSFFALACAVVAAAAIGCSAPDPGEVTFRPGHTYNGTGPAPTGTPTTPAPPPSPMHDGGVAGPSEGGTPESGVDAGPPNAFTGAPAYASKIVTPTAAQNHAMRGVQVTPNYQVDCLSCHNGQGLANKFLLAGSIYTDANAGTGAADIEISVHSDADGNFWVLDKNSLATPGMSGARDGQNMQLMMAAVPNGSCNSCHNNNQNPVLHVP